MTVIAWSQDSRTLAADTRIVVGARITNGDKIWRVRNRLYGAAGDAASCAAVYYWLQKGGRAQDRPTLDKDAEFEGLLIEPDGAVCILDERLIPVSIRGDYAIGSGAEFAIALMATGMSSENAVLTIIEKNLADGCGGEVQRLSLGRRKRKSS